MNNKNDKISNIINCSSFFLNHGLSSGGNMKPTMKFAYIAKLKNESFHDGIAKGLIKEMAKLKV